MKIASIIIQSITSIYLLISFFTNTISDITLWITIIGLNIALILRDFSNNN